MLQNWGQRGTKNCSMDDSVKFPDSGFTLYACYVWHCQLPDAHSRHNFLQTGSIPVIRSAGEIFYLTQLFQSAGDSRSSWVTSRGTHALSSCPICVEGTFLAIRQEDQEVDHLTTYAAEVNERVELYLRFTSTPFGQLCFSRKKF
jgi:hypothetical protein